MQQPAIGQMIDPLFDNTLAKDAKRTLYLDEVRRCPEQNLSLGHYTPEGPCRCKTKRSRVIEGIPARLDRPPVARIPITRDGMFRVSTH